MTTLPSSPRPCEEPSEDGFGIGYQGHELDQPSYNSHSHEDSDDEEEKIQPMTHESVHTEMVYFYESLHARFLKNEASQIDP